MKIAISTSSFGKFDSLPINLCKSAGLDYVLNPYGRVLSEQEAMEFYADCIGVIAGTEPITAKVMQANPHLQVISRCGVGVDNVDLSWANKHNIQILCTPEAPTQATAELTLTLILSLLRHTAIMNSNLHQGVWKKHMGNLLHKKRVGIVGYGRIGKVVAKLLLPFECEIACYDPFIKYCDCKQMNFNELLAWAEIITLHCTMPEQHAALINAKSISKMRRGSWLINTARGGLVDDVALNDALNSGYLAGAALDVFEVEPYNGVLLGQKKALLTPHASSYAKESRIEMEVLAMKNLLRELRKHRLNQRFLNQ